MKDMKVIIGLLAVLTVFVTCVMLKLGPNVFIPLVIAWFLSYMMSPAVRFFARRKVPPALTTLVLIAFLLCVAGLAGYFFKELIAGQADRYALYYDRLQEIWDRLTAQFSFLSVELDAKNVSLSDVQKMFFKVYYPVAHAVSYTVMALFFLMFMLIGSPYIEDKICAAFPERSAHVLKVLDAISGQITRFISVMTAISAVTGVMTWLALSWIGVDFAPMWGVLAFLLSFIPKVGGAVASIPPIFVAFVQFQSALGASVLGVSPRVIATVAAILLVQTCASVVMTMLMGGRMKLSPVVILISLLVWSSVWGAAGALLSIPIAATFKIICDNVERLRPIGILMSSGHCCVGRKSGI